MPRMQGYTGAKRKSPESNETEGNSARGIIDYQTRNKLLLASATVKDAADEESSASDSAEGSDAADEESSAIDSTEGSDFTASATVEESADESFEDSNTADSDISNGFIGSDDSAAEQLQRTVLSEIDIRDMGNHVDALKTKIDLFKQKRRITKKAKGLLQPPTDQITGTTRRLTK